ncbi:hypothetical protein B0H10DRAFT_207756 [Mycena sp. CBHHK59/15]|nr:hypothetical protein B0H10DRAFT_207756 [Mycena sp. CBHHK59/15]
MGDTLELRRLSSVSRAWATHAKDVIFRDVWVRYDTVDRLLALLRTKPKLGRNIRTLRVVERGRLPSAVLERLVPLLIDLMPNLRTLDVLYRHFGGVASLQPARNLLSIIGLRLRSGSYQSGEDVLRFIALFPRLESLEMSGSWDGPYAGCHAVGTLLMPRIHLKYLLLSEHHYAAPIASWIARDEVTVDRLDVVGALGVGGEPFGDMVRKIGGGVRHLEYTELTVVDILGFFAMPAPDK